MGGKVLGSDASQGKIDWKVVLEIVGKVAIAAVGVIEIMNKGKKK